MAVYFLRSRHISRAKGARATRAAAYRAGERIRDERTSEVYDYRHRNDVVYKDIILPADLASQTEMGWALDRSTLWNAAEQAGKRRNSRLAREWLVLIPPELSAEQRKQLVRHFAAELVEQYRCAVDVAIHRPRPGADPRNQHAHLLMTTREVGPTGLGRRVSLEVSGPERYQRGMTVDSRTEYLGLRERWASLANEALREAGIAQRIDHRSLAAQGIDRDPTTSIPDKVFYAELKYGPSTAGEAIRARALERAEARRRGPEELARVLAEQKTALRQKALQDRERRDSAPAKPRWGQLTREERNAVRRGQYQARRALEKQDPVLEQRRRDVRRREYLSSIRKRDPQIAREATRRYRAAHREAYNANQRDYRRKRRELQLSKGAVAEKSPTAEQSLQNWQAWRQLHGSGPTPEDSLRNWQEYRARANGIADSGTSPVPPDPDRQRGTQSRDQSDEPHPHPQPDHDLGL